MKERPMLFSAQMVKSILAGTKTETRRIVKPKTHICPYGQAGDRLWVRETFMPMPHLNAKAFYRASDPLVGGKWKPSIFMPRHLSRITLEITGVRVERLQDISEEDARAEGCAGHRAFDGYGIDPFHDVAPIDEYRELWESINGKDSWAANPWVSCISFTKLP